MNIKTLQSEVTDANANGNGAAATPATPKVLPGIRQKFLTDGGKFADGKAVPSTAQLKTAKAAGKELIEAYSKVEAAEAALEAAKEAVAPIARKVMEATGATSVTIQGREFIPMEKGGKAYFRTAGQRSSVDL